MGKLRLKNMLVFFLVLPLSTFMLLSCNQYDDPPTSQTMRGKVIDIPFNFITLYDPDLPPALRLGASGVTVEVVSNDPNSPCRCECLDDGSVYRTTTDAYGNWEIKNVPIPITWNDDAAMYMRGPQILLKLTKEGYHTQYGAFMVGDEEDWGLNFVFHNMLTNPPLHPDNPIGALLLPPADLGNSSLVLGMNFGITGTEFPMKFDVLLDVIVSLKDKEVPVDVIPWLDLFLPEEAKKAIEENILPLLAPPGDERDLKLDMMVYSLIQDATRNGTTSLELSGTREDGAIMSMDITTCPGAVVQAAAIDVVYIPTWDSRF